jgi:hypothetical protein
MRTMRIFIAVAALSLIAAACGDDDAATTTAPDDTNGSVATTTATTAGSTGGGANGSIIFEISGDYEASGEFPFVPAASVFSNGGWSASFAEDGSNAIIAMNTIPGSLTVSYGDSEAVVIAIELVGCTFDMDQNDSSGLVGSFECEGITGGLSQSGATITVDFRGEFSAP